jgi:hypothetical protein
MKQSYVPIRYVPKKLKGSDKQKQIRMLLKSRKMYKRNKYYTREKLKTFHSKKSNHINNAKKMYKIQKITPNKQLSLATGCSISSLKKIVRKGEGAYYSSGSRPNQTAQSWGLARLASAVTGGRASTVDFDIIQKGCNHNKKAYLLANKTKKIYSNGLTKTKKIKI